MLYSWRQAGQQGLSAKAHANGRGLAEVSARDGHRDIGQERAAFWLGFLFVKEG